MKTRRKRRVFLYLRRVPDMSGMGGLTESGVFQREMWAGCGHGGPQIIQAEHAPYGRHGERSQHVTLDADAANRWNRKGFEDNHRAFALVGC